jgi:hypothetical protein
VDLLARDSLRIIHGDDDFYFTELSDHRLRAAHYFSAFEHRPRRM